MKQETIENITTKVSKETLEKAYTYMAKARAMAEVYDENRSITKYVHSTSRGHEAIQLATAFQLTPRDIVSPYYRDESILLGLGFSPYELMLQLLAKKDDPFSGGRTYYAHPSYNGADKPLIPHQSSATGMQAIPTTGAAQGVKYLENQGLAKDLDRVTVCSLGDGSVTEGEVSEAFSFAALHQLPIIFLVQDNEWGISVSSDEARTNNAYEYAAGFTGLERVSIDGSFFPTAYSKMKAVTDYVRTERKPILVHATCPLLGHHTSGVRKEWYRGEEDLKKHSEKDPLPLLHEYLINENFATEEQLNAILLSTRKEVEQDFQKAVDSPDPELESVHDFEFAPSPVTEEKGIRTPSGREKVVMVDAALYAVEEIMRKHPEALFYGQDVGGRLGGVFREAATLAQKYGDSRVFNTAIQEAYIVGSTVGMSAVGCKPIVEIQFADYIWPGVNQLVTELSKCFYLSNGKFNVQSLIRIPIGAYGGGGPYHSGCIESAILSVRGIKVCMPSNAADLKGLLKGAFYDPNPVVMFEHKGLYWSKVPGTAEAKTVEPDEEYIIPLGKARIAQSASQEMLDEGRTMTVITYGMGVHWALNASKAFPGQIEIIDLRTLNPVDHETVFESVKTHSKVLVLTEEQLLNSFAEALAARIQKACFQHLDGPVETFGALNLPAIPLNADLESVMLPTTAKVENELKRILNA